MKSAAFTFSFVLVCLCFSACIPEFSKGRLKAIVSSDHSEFLIEKTTLLEGAPPSKLPELFPDLPTGVANSLDGVGMCYWHVEAHGETVSLNDANGNPNEEVRDNMISLGELITPKMIRFSDLLSSMKESEDPELEKKADNVASSTGEAHNAFLQAGVALGVITIGDAATQQANTPQARRMVSEMQHNLGILTGPQLPGAHKMVRVFGADSLSSTIGGFEKSRDIRKILGPLQNQLRTQGRPNISTRAYAQVKRFRTTAHGVQEVLMVVEPSLTGGSQMKVRHFYRASHEKKIGKVMWKEASENSVRKFTRIPKQAFDDSLKSLRLLAKTGGKSSVGGKTGALVSKELFESSDMVFHSASKGARRFAKECATGSAAARLTCLAVLGTFFSAGHAVSRAYNRQPASPNRTVKGLRQMPEAQPEAPTQNSTTESAPSQNSPSQSPFDILAEDTDLIAKLNNLFSQVTRSITVEPAQLALLKQKIIERSKESQLPPCEDAFQADVAKPEEDTTVESTEDSQELVLPPPADSSNTTESSEESTSGEDEDEDDKEGPAADEANAAEEPNADQLFGPN